MKTFWKQQNCKPNPEGIHNYEAAGRKAYHPFEEGRRIRPGQEIGSHWLD